MAQDLLESSLRLTRSIFAQNFLNIFSNVTYSLLKTGSILAKSDIYQTWLKACLSPALVILRVCLS